jgi:hypothetical protein
MLCGGVEFSREIIYITVEMISAEVFSPENPRELLGE